MISSSYDKYCWCLTPFIQNNADACNNEWLHIKQDWLNDNLSSIILKRKQRNASFNLDKSVIRVCKLLKKQPCILIEGNHQFKAYSEGGPKLRSSVYIGVSK